MTPEDRELLLALRRRQDELQHSLETLTAQLTALEARVSIAVAPEISFPPLPADEPLFPPLPDDLTPELVLPPLPSLAGLPPLPELPPFPPAPVAQKRSIEFRFGRWLVALGAFFGVIALALVLSLARVQHVLGHAGLLGISATISLAVVVFGLRLDRVDSARRYFGRMVTAMALAWLYLTAYAACYYEPVRVIHNPVIGGFLLLLWSIYVFLLAERKKSQILGLFAVTLAYISTALNPIGFFTMGADLLLCGTACLFLIRNGWAVLSYFSLAGTYIAALRRLVIDENGELVLDTSRTLHFLPYVVYLLSAWLILTVGIILTTAATFRGPRRFILVSLNNGAMSALLLLSAYIVGYGYGPMGCTLLATGFLFLITSRFAGFADVEPVDIMAAYAAQGLALVTAGVIVACTGVSRAFILMMETFFLGMAAAFSGDRILAVSTYVAGSFATLFLIWEVAVNAHHPWLLGFGGALVMLINAWWCRAEFRHSTRARSTIVLSSSCFCCMALGLIATSLWSDLSASQLPPALALAALVLTFAIYQVALFELPPLAQILLIVAQVLVLFPSDTGEELPGWSTACVAAVTLLLATWWSRQRITRSGPWTFALTFLYALALVGLTYQTIRPAVSSHGWIIAASALSFAFLCYGAFTRVWTLAAAGQLFLAVALYHFFFPPGSGAFPWGWKAGLVTTVVVLATARAALEWLRLFPEVNVRWSRPLRFVAAGYLLLALVMLIRMIFAFVPPLNQVAAFLFLGTLILSWNVRRLSSFGVRCSFALSAVGACLYLGMLSTASHQMATVINALAMLVFLAQPALLRHEGPSLVTRLETWALIVLSVGTGWVFISAWVVTRLTAGYLTMGWALYALFLFLFGLLVWERRFRWCGLAILLAAIIRVFCSDFWGLSNGYRVLTFFLLTIITLGLGYIILRLADRRESWL